VRAVKEPQGERGAALLAVLMLVGVMAAIAAVMLERSRTSAQLVGNLLARERAGGLFLVAESLAAARVDRLVAAGGAAVGGAAVGGAGDWQGQATVLPLPGGSASIAAFDGGTCFNVNSLVSMAGPEALVTRPLAVAQFAALMRALDVPEPKARQAAAAAADWIDSDQQPAAFGAEDAAYAARGYLTGGTLMAEPSELRAVLGVDAGLYQRLRPFVCALPEAVLSPLNVNSLRAGDSPLLAMLLPETLGPPQVRLRLAGQVLAARPQAGWGSVAEFGNAPLLRGTPLPADVLQQLTVRTGWFRLALEVRSGDRVMPGSLLLDARCGLAAGPAKVVLRRGTGED